MLTFRALALRQSESLCGEEASRVGKLETVSLCNGLNDAHRKV